ncbi:hypothetical protein [Clostridium akagii]|uniref:hypothetical protein n=1 Tax=Clostridium akagii TaxID=91623 RepID=UPI0004799343|nr:hypothetical protein [Clostridium akagii]
MNKKHYKLIKLNKTIMVVLLCLITLSVLGIYKAINYQKNAIEAGTKETINKKNKDISISYRITFLNKISGVNSDIINAAVQGMFDYESKEDNIFKNRSNDYVLIMDAKKTWWDTWKVYFVSKEKETDTYPSIGYSFVTVQKQKSGDYKGFIINSGGPIIKAGAK